MDSEGPKVVQDKCMVVKINLKMGPSGEEAQN